VPKPMASAKSMASAKPIVGAPAHCPVLKPIANTPAYCRYPSLLPVPKDNTGTHAQAVPTHTGCAQTAPPRTGAQHHARPGPTSACRRRPTASAPSSLPLFAAPDAWRWAANIKPQETKAKRTPCSTLSSVTPCPYGPAQARGTLCPRTPAVLKSTVGTQSPLSVLQPIAGAPVHRRCSGLSSVLKPTVGAPAYGRYSGPWSVLKPMVGTPVHGRCSNPWSVLKPMVGTQTHGRCPHRKTEDRRPAPRSTRPNKRVQATANKLRSFVAPLVGRA
jgi:hypothetical protein